MLEENKEENDNFKKNEEQTKDEIVREEKENQVRDWKTIFIGIIFIFIVVVIWYIIQAI